MVCHPFGSMIRAFVTLYRGQDFHDFGDHPPDAVAHAVAAAIQPLRRGESQSLFDQAVRADLEKPARTMAIGQSMPGQDGPQRRAGGEHFQPGRLAQQRQEDPHRPVFDRPPRGLRFQHDVPPIPLRPLVPLEHFQGHRLAVMPGERGSHVAEVHQQIVLRLRDRLGRDEHRLDRRRLRQGFIELAEQGEKVIATLRLCGPASQPTWTGEMAAA